MSSFDDNEKRQLFHLYSGWTGYPAHPYSPDGGGGSGGFRQSEPIGMEGIAHSFSSLPHPDSPDGWTLTHLDIVNAMDKVNKHTQAISSKQKTRQEENEGYLKNANVKAFLATIAQTEGGDYDLMYGGVIGKKHDKWRITNYSLPPQPGIGGKNTPSGRYQITKVTWQDLGVNKLGLTDFTPNTQDLIAVEILRVMGALPSLIDGDIGHGYKSSIW